MFATSFFFLCGGGDAKHLVSNQAKLQEIAEMTESCQIIKQARSTFQIGDKLCWFCSHETRSRNQDWTLYHNVAEFYTWRTAPCVDKSLTWKERGFTRWIFASQPFYSLPPAPATFISFSSLWSWWLQSSGCCSWRSRNSSCRRTRSWWLPSAPKQWIAQMAGAAPQGGFLLNHRPRHISDACSHTWPYFKCQHCVEDFSNVL